MTAMANLAVIGLGMFQKHINDPKTRLEAIQDFECEMMKLAKEVTDGSNTPEKIDALESIFLDAIRAL